MKDKMVEIGTELSLGELREMAARQQQQIDSQQQMLVAKEQRLKYLKQQEARQQQAAGESERLARLREHVKQQEHTLQKLRSLRGQVMDTKSTNNNLGAELDNMKSLFGHKEKELTDAVNKVEQLKRQLEQLRQGKITANISQGPSSFTLSQENIEDLKNKLAVRNTMNEEQNKELARRREALQKRKEEMSVMDHRISELQHRLSKKTSKRELQTQPDFPKRQIGGLNRPSSAGSNVAAVEPYVQQKPKESPPDPKLQSVEGFSLGKQDPKYQTLPHNLKFPKSIEHDDKTDATNNSKNTDINIRISEKLNNWTNKLESNTKTNASSDAPRSYQQRNLLAPRPYSSSVMTGIADTSVVSTVQSPSMIYATNSSPIKETPKTSTPRPLSGSYTTISPQKEKFMMGDSRDATGSTAGTITQTSDSVPSPVSTIVGSLSSNIAVPTVVSSTRAGHTTYQVAASRSHPTERRNIPPYGLQTNPPHKEITSVPHQVTPAAESFASSLTASSMPGRSVSNNEESIPSSDRPSYTSSGPTSEPQRQEATTAFTTSESHDELDHVDTSPVSVSSALSVLMTNNQPAASRPSYRYATKSVIANTYMKKLGTNTMEQYRKNMNTLYKDFMGNEQSTDTKLATVSPMPVNTSAGQKQGNESDMKLLGNQDKTGDMYQYDKYHENQPLYPGSYADHERFRHRPNAPRPLRRRWSITETDEHPSRQSSRHPASDQVTDVVHVDRAINDQDQIGGKAQRSNSESVASGDQRRFKTGLQAAVFRKKTNLKTRSSTPSISRRVSFDPLALLLDASLEGELELVMRTAKQVTDPSTANDEGITALHNAICAGHYDIVKFLVKFGCNVNAPDSDGWTPLHCAASCNNLAMVEFLVEYGACIFATTISDHETAAEKCEEDEDGFDGCSQYLYGIQEKLGILNGGVVYAVFDYQAQNVDELSFGNADMMKILRKGDEQEVEWWWARHQNREGYLPRNLLGLHPRASPKWKPTSDI